LLLKKFVVDGKIDNGGDRVSTRLFWRKNGGDWTEYDLTAGELIDASFAKNDLLEFKVEYGNPYAVRKDEGISIKNIEAIVEYAEFILAISSTSGGTTDLASGFHHYSEGAEVIVMATPDEDFLFDHWELDGVTRTENPINVLMDSNHTLHTVFVAVPPPYTPIGYCSVEDIQGVLEQFSASSGVTEEDIAKAIGRAEREIDGYLQTIYKTPLSLPVDGIVRNATIEFAMLFLIEKYYATQIPEGMPISSEWYKRAERKMDKILSGRIKLVNADYIEGVNRNKDGKIIYDVEPKTRRSTDNFVHYSTGGKTSKFNLGSWEKMK